MVSLAFLVTVLLLPWALSFVPLFTKKLVPSASVLALTSGVGIVLERILFFRMEQPVFFLSRN